MTTQTRKFSEMLSDTLEEGKKAAGLNESDQNAIMTVNLQFGESGTTAERPSSPPTPFIRYNTDLSKFEFWNGSNWSQLEDSNDVSALIARLAAHTAGDGASMIGLEDQGSVSSQTVQDMSEANFLVVSDVDSLVNGVAMDTLSSGLFVNENGNGTPIFRTIVGTSNQIDVANGDGVAGNIQISIAVDPEIAGNGSITIPAGTTAQRPSSAQEGMVRYNTDLDDLEFWNSSTASWESVLSSGVTSGQGTANQVLVNGTSGTQQTGDLVFSLPQDIATSSTPTFAGGTLTGALNMSTQLINNVLTPASDLDAANKQYVDEAVKDMHFLNPVRVASTSNFSATYDNGTAGVGATLTATANGAASIDGVSLALNDRVLFKNQTSDLENGIYYVSQVGDASNPAIYTRATDFNEPSEIVAGDLVPVLEGTSNEKTMWIQTADVNTIGTDSITFVQFSADFSNVVTIDGTQAITGSKTFSSVIDSSAGINFGTSTLNVYEEDQSWTPTLVGSVVAGSPTGIFAGRYTRIGDMVHLSGRIVLTSLGSIEGNISIGGLPYPVRSGPLNRAALNVSFRNNFVNNFVIGGFTQEGTQQILLFNMEVDNTRVTHNDLAAINLYFSISYATSA